MKTNKYLNRRAPRISQFVHAILICVMGAVTSQWSTGAVGASQHEDASATIERLRLATAGHRRDIEALETELKAQGKVAVPLIKEAAKHEQGILRVHLVRILGGIPDDEATDALVELFLQESDAALSGLARSHLENRVIRRPLSREQLNMLSSQIQSSQVNAIGAGGWARILSLCISNNPVERAQPIIRRLKAEISQSAGENTYTGHGSYLSDEAVRINQFLIALANITNSAVSEQLRSESAEAQIRVSRVWLTIAVGMTGGEAATEELKRLVESEPNVSVRALALRAYARSAKEKARPFLEKFIGDETPFGRDVAGGPMHPLQIVARDELSRLGNGTRQ